tara:strand:+ start:310 stop:504 length:195 start_codon:yes stop_codon:yes gene_type:complete
MTTLCKLSDNEIQILNRIKKLEEELLFLKKELRDIKSLASNSESEEASLYEDKGDWYSNHGHGD